VAGPLGVGSPWSAFVGSGGSAGLQRFISIAFRCPCSSGGRAVVLRRFVLVSRGGSRSCGGGCVCLAGCGSLYLRCPPIEAKTSLQINLRFVMALQERPRKIPGDAEHDSQLWTVQVMFFPLHFHRQKTLEELQREKIAADAKELKAYLNSLTPEARAKFWAEIEGKGDNQNTPTPPGK